MKVLFVCTANTCRSPMAEEIFNKLIDILKIFSFCKRDFDTEILDKIEFYANQIKIKRIPLNIKDVSIDGNDLIGLGLIPSKKFNEIFKYLVKHLQKHPEDNYKEKLIQIVNNKYIKEL